MNGGQRKTARGRSPVSLAKGYHPEAHGFWDYTTPGAGGMEHYRREDYRLLLEDMRRAGMNSLAINVKWLTTGYRSRLPFLDQAPGNLMIASDNRLLHEVIEDAARRDIGVWLAAVVSMFPTDTIKSPALRAGHRELPGAEKFLLGVYDLDSREVTTRAARVFEELVTLFPQAKGLIVEVECSGYEMPHRVPLYNRWAKLHGQPRFETLGHPMECRYVTIAPWREYTTHRRVQCMRLIESAVRAKGFRGELTMLCETNWQPCLLAQEVDLQEFRRGCPDWGVVSYEGHYNKSRGRHGMMELSVEEPRKAGLKTYYLPRGVMTWTAGDEMNKWPLPISLEESWRMDLEDIARYQPEGVWWFGSGGLRKGCHVDPARLRKAGYQDGRAARQALLRQIANFPQ